MEINNKEREKWFEERFEESIKGLSASGFDLFMEVKMYPEKLLEKQNRELYDAAKQSTVPTFGWPIGIFLEQRPECKPQPGSDGIKAEIAIKDKEWPHESYDFWAIKKDGALFILKSLFESSRKPGNLFFDTRIIRVTEVFMYAHNLYSKLGLDKDDKIVFEIKHVGIKGLAMGVAGNRLLFSNYKNYSNQNESTSGCIKITMEELDKETPKLVGTVVNPLFEVFDWFKVGEEIIKEIVLNYKNGKIT